MPIDPNIILQGMPQGIDVNALMQQQMQGMQNINAMERQRRADAMAMEDRAAQQAAAQEQAALRALTPAVAMAFSDPSDAGLNAAFSMVPEEYAGVADEQLAQLRAIPDVEQRKAVIRGALLQDDYGKALLAQLEPTANMRLQEATAARRAALDERRLALEEARLAAEAEGRGMTPYQQAQIELERAKLEQAAAKETTAETQTRLKEEKRAKDLDLAIGEVERVMQPGGLIDQSTGSYIGNLIDGAVATIGAGTPGYEANAKLAPVADLVLKMVPRFEGPQSNFDVQSYKDAAGNLADPTVPASVKKAAATEIVRLFKKYRDQFEYAGDDGAAGGGEQALGVIDFGDLGD